MFTSTHISQTYFLAANPLNPSAIPCLYLYNLYYVSCTIVFCGLASESNTRTFLVLCYPKETSTLGYLMVFKLKRRPINISCFCLASKNMSQPLRFALGRLTVAITAIFRDQ